MYSENLRTIFLFDDNLRTSSQPRNDFVELLIVGVLWVLNFVHLVFVSLLCLVCFLGNINSWILDE